MEQTESEVSKNNPDAAKVSIASAEYSVFEDTVKRSTAELHSALGAFQVPTRSCSKSCARNSSRGTILIGCPKLVCLDFVAY